MITGIFIPQHTAESQIIADTVRSPRPSSQNPVPDPDKIREVKELEEGVEELNEKSAILEEQTKRNSQKAQIIERKVERTLKKVKAGPGDAYPENQNTDTMFQNVVVDVFVPVEFKSLPQRRGFAAWIRGIFCKK